MQARALNGLDPEETMAVVISKTFTTAETMLNARTVRSWLTSQLGERYTAERGEGGAGSSNGGSSRRKEEQKGTAQSSTQLHLIDCRQELYCCPVLGGSRVGKAAVFALVAVVAIYGGRVCAALPGLTPFRPTIPSL